MPVDPFMESIPPYINLVFVATTLAAYGIVLYALKVSFPAKNRKTPNFIGVLLLLWLATTASLAYDEFFLDYSFKPPKLLLFVGAFTLIILSSFFFKSSRKVLKAMPITSLTYLHIIRVPVEIVLWWLFLQGMVPEDMTFEGMNYDMLSGITAPFAALFLVGQKTRSRIGAVIWNLAAIGLLINVVARAIMATPYFFDSNRFDLPNLAVMYSPYIWLPAFIVPIVLMAHLISLYQLFTEEKP